jgi:putative colanic acid biosynthesis acetyltransferase WcaF
MSTRLRPRNPSQIDRYASPWPLRERLGMALWIVVSAALFRTTPKQLNPWRLFLLKLFGAKISGVPFVAPSCIIKIPWLLTLEDRCALAPKSEVYNLAHVTLKARCVVSQYAYICGGTHDLSDPALPLLVGDIVIGEEAFIGAKAFIMPGIEIGQGAVLGAAAVATRDLEPWTIYAGNPARPIGKRDLQANSSGSSA